MGDVLIELAQILISRKEKLTRQEQVVLATCKANAVQDFAVGAFVASLVTWAATRRLDYLLRINLVGGAAFFSGMWRFGSSLDSCMDHILALEESRMQQELAKLIITKHQDDPRRMQLIRKHFYEENVFIESSMDRPISRWRHRNFSVDNVAQSQRTNETDTCGDKTAVKHNRLNTGASDVMIADPFDCVFGRSGMGEEIQHPNTDAGLPKRRLHSRKRAHRRNRMNQPEVDSSSEHAGAQVE